MCPPEILNIGIRSFDKVEVEVSNGESQVCHVVLHENCNVLPFSLFHLRCSHLILMFIICWLEYNFPIMECVNARCKSLESLTIV